MADEAAPVVFSRDVAPILVGRCQACHGLLDFKGGYQLLNYTLMRKAGDSGSETITPGKPEESEVYNLISSTDPDLRMPKDADPLTAQQIATVKRWIAEGAKYDLTDPTAQLASIVPKSAQPDPP